jgi:hypothetical protein
LEAQKEEQVTSKKRRFCTAFPEDVLKHFHALSSFSEDEIEGHMYMFSKELNGDHYKRMLEAVKEVLRKELPRVSHARFRRGD